MARVCPSLRISPALPTTVNETANSGNYFRSFFFIYRRGLYENHGALWHLSRKERMTKAEAEKRMNLLFLPQFV